MPPRSDLVTERFERAARTVGDGNVSAERGANGIAKLRKAAAEKLPARLELRAQAKKTEWIVARHVDAVAHLV